MDGDFEFSDVFKKEFLDNIIVKIENLIEFAAPHEKDHHDRNFASNLFKLGKRIQDEEYISRARLKISNYSSHVQSDIYRQIGDYDQEKTQIEDRKNIEIAFDQWVKSFQTRHVTDPSDILKLNLRDLKKLTQKSSEMMSPTDYFRNDLRMLESLYTNKMYEFFEKGLKLSLTFIESSPLFFQPLLLAFLANQLIEKKEKVEIIQYLEKADEIIKEAEPQVAKTPIFALSGGWNQYYQEKAKILRKLETVDDTSKLIEKEFEASKKDPERWRFDANQLDQCLFLGDKVKVQEIIDIGIKNLYNALATFPFTFVTPLMKDKPPKGVKQEIWLFSRNFLKDKLLEIINSFDSEKQPSLRFNYLVEILKLLTNLNAIATVRKTSIKIIATLQEAIRSLAPLDLQQDIKSISVEILPWDFQMLLHLTMSRSNLIFVITRADYWEYYKSTDKNAEIKYDQFDSLYKKWFRGYRTGPCKLNLYINIPYVYDSLIDIFEKMGEDNLVSLCLQNVKIFRKARLSEVQKVPSSGKEDREWYANLLTLIQNELEELMKIRDYITAKERFNQAFELLEFEGVQNDDHGDGLALDPLLLSVIRLFEILTKY